MILWNNLTTILSEFGEKLKEAYQSELETKNINATKNLSDSVRWQLEINGEVYEVELMLADYYKYVEEGRRAGKYPPKLPIQRWIVAKRILPRPMANGKLPTLQQLTFLIQRSIAENGTDGQHPLQNSVEQVWNEYEDKISDAITKDIVNSLS